MPSKIIKTPRGFNVTMVRSGSNDFACCNCGQNIDADDYMAGCSDCGGIFCETCVTNGEFDSHNCADAYNEGNR